MLCAEYKPVDLGQGCPNYLPEELFTNTLHEVSLSTNPELVQQAREAVISFVFVQRTY